MQIGQNIGQEAGQYIFDFLFWGFSLCSIMYILAWGIVGGIIGLTWVKRKIISKG